VKVWLLIDVSATRLDYSDSGVLQTWSRLSGMQNRLMDEIWVTSRI